LSINPDAHSIRELNLVRWGVAIARKGGLARKNVLNTMALPALLKHLQRKQPRAARPRIRNKEMVPAVPCRGKKRNQVR
jgi:DNA polymerase (family X)